MGRSGPGVLDLISSIGLRAPYTKTAADWKASEGAPVKEFYDLEIPKLCKLHYTKTNDEILHGTVTRDAAEALFREYGPRIWSRVKHRPWLFNPGEVTKHTPYTKKLYFENAEDHEFLKEAVCTLVIERIFRHHKENVQKAREGSVDGSYRSTPPIRSSRSSLATGSGGVGPACFATALGLDAHQDATTLQEQGVWLGDYGEEKNAINGPSYDDVQRDYFFQTDAGSRKGYDEPYVFEEATETTEEYLHCAACKGGALLKIECHEFEWKDDDSETTMTKNVWTYPCYLAGRKVFALIKQMPHIQSDTPVWGFWRVDGGYTSNLLLASRLKRASEPGNTTDRAKRTKSDQRGNTDLPHAPSSPASRSDDQAERSTRRWASINAAAAASQSALPYAASTKALGKLPLRSAPNWHNQAESSIEDDEDVYNATPRPQDHPAPSGFFRQYTQAATADALHVPQEPGSKAQEYRQQPSHVQSIELPRHASETLRAMSTPITSEATRFRFFISVSWAPGQNVVVLDDTMDLQAVYSRVQRTMTRKLEGHPVAYLSFIIPGRSKPLDIEPDDEYGWEIVLESIKEAGMSAVEGSLTRTQ